MKKHGSICFKVLIAGSEDKPFSTEGLTHKSIKVIVQIKQSQQGETT